MIINTQLFSLVWSNNNKWQA